MRELIGIPYDQQNCGQIVRRGLASLGLHGAAEALPVDETSAEALIRLGGVWERLEGEPCKATQGQVILSDGRAGDGSLHVSLALGDGTALTSHRRQGSCIVPIWSISGPRGVFRYRPDS